MIWALAFVRLRADLPQQPPDCDHRLRDPFRGCSPFVIFRSDLSFYDGESVVVRPTSCICVWSIRKRLPGTREFSCLKSSCANWEARSARVPGIFLSITGTQTRADTTEHLEAT